MATATNTRTARPRPAAANLKPSAASTKAGGAMFVKSGAAKPNPLAGNNVKPTGAPKPKPGATTMQMGPAQLDAVHRKVIQSIEGAEKAMSMARADIQTAKSSKYGRNKVVAKANVVVGALLTPGRHVVVFLSGLGVLFSPFKQVSSALAALIKHELGRPEKDVRVAIVHFDLATALVHVGTLNRKSRPSKSLGDPLCELMKNFKDLIQEFGQFSEAYYETRAPEYILNHLLDWKGNKDQLDGFADRIAQLKNDLISLLSEQAVPHPGKHADALAQIESRLTENRAFYGTIMDANEEAAEVLLSKQGLDTPVRDGGVLKQLAGVVGQGVGVVGQGVTHGVSRVTSAIKKGTVTTLKQVTETMLDSNQKTTQRSFKAFSTSIILGTLDELVSGSPQKVQVDPRSGPYGGQNHARKQAMSTRIPPRGDHSGRQQINGTGGHAQKQVSNNTYVPARGQQHSGHRHVKGTAGHAPKQAVNTHVPAHGWHSGWQQMKGTGEHSHEPQTSSVWGQPFPDTTEYQEYGWFQGDVLPTSRDLDQATEYQAYGWFQDVADDEGNMEEGFEGAVEQFWDGEGTDEQELGQYSLDEYADGELAVDDDDEGADCGDQGKDDNHAGSEPGGDDGKYQEPYYRQDGDDEAGDEGRDYYSGDD